MTFVIRGLERQEKKKLKEVMMENFPNSQERQTQSQGAEQTPQDKV